jgi:hypothetical protein
VLKVREDAAVAEPAEQNSWSSVLTPSRLGIVVLTVVSLAAGYIGLNDFLHLSISYHHSPLDLLYYDLQLFLLAAGPVNQGGPFPWLLELARFTAPAATVYALVEAARLLFADEIRRLRTRRMRGHVIVCGSTPTARALAATIRDGGHEVVAVTGETSWATADGSTAASTNDPRDHKVLIAAGLRGARTVYACLQDATANVATAVAVSQVARPAGSPTLRVYAQIDDPDLCLALRARRWGGPARDGLRLDFFNPEELAARKLCQQTDMRSLDGPAPEVAVTGLEAFGQAVVVNLAKRWRLHSDGRRLRIALIGPGASTVASRLESRHRFLATECELAAHEGTLSQYLTDRTADGLAAPNRVYLCDQDSQQALSTALTTPGLWRAAPGSIVVRVDRLDGLREAFQDGPGPARLLDALNGRLRLIGVTDVACDPMVIDEDLVELLAQAVHEHYVLERRADGQSVAQNPSMADWTELTEDLRDANREQARDIGAKLTTIQCTLTPLPDSPEEFTFTAAELELLAEREHERWMEQRLAKGWVYDPKRNDTAKRHTDLLPWAELDDPTQDKDRQAIAALPEILADAGFMIVRTGG